MLDEGCAVVALGQATQELLQAVVHAIRYGAMLWIDNDIDNAIALR